MKIGYYVTPLKKHQQFELDFGNFGTIALTREAVIELVENLKAALEEHPAAQQSVHPTLLTPRPETVATKQNILAALEAIKQSQSG